MSAIRSGFAAALLVTVGWSAAWAQPAASRAVAPGVQTSLDRTAMWVGDRVTYVVTFNCPRGIDVLEEDLAADKLKLDGLDVISTDSSRHENGEGEATRTFRYVLAAYRVHQPSARIAPFTVRYYVTRPGQRLQEAAPAGQVELPGAVLAVRSTLPEEQATLALRDAKPAAARPAMYVLAQPVGLALIVVAIAPAALGAIALVARRRARRAARSGRQARRQERASLEAARAIDPATIEGRREVYTQIDALVREHLEHTAAVPGRCLTPQEVDAALAGRDSRVPAASVVALLDECERARYAPPDRMPPADACREALALAGEVVSSRR